MNKIQQLLRTEKSTDELSSWNMAFVTTDGRCKTSTPIYEIILDALARMNFTGKLLLFAKDVFEMTQYPTYLVQMIPVARENSKEVRGPGYEAFNEFRDLVAKLSQADTGLSFLAEYAELGDAYEPLAQSILRGNAVFKNGKAVQILPTNEEEQTLFEELLRNTFPAISEEEPGNLD